LLVLNNNFNIANKKRYNYAYCMLPFPMTLSDLQSELFQMRFLVQLCGSTVDKISTDPERRVVSLRQLSLLFSLVYSV